MKLQRIVLVESPWTAAQREIDSIIHDSIVWHAANRPTDPYDDDAPTVVDALRGERRALGRWRPYTGDLHLVQVRVGNLCHLVAPIPLYPRAFELRYGAPVGVGGDLHIELESHASEDREYRITILGWRPDPT
jgi:hypothetical protein